MANNLPLLKVEKLKRTFISPDGESNLILDIPTFKIRAGEHIGIQGNSGSGKTTFLNLLAGILNADSGSIAFDSRELTLLSESERDVLRAKNIGYIFQTFNLLQGYTALENVTLAMMFAGKPDKKYAFKLLENVGLGNRMDYKPAQLSVGQQQRVALARALANRPKIVLADEPTGNLDYRRAGQAVKLIKELCIVNGASLIFVSHDLDVLDDFDTVLDFTILNRAFTS
ncbi:MAG: ABC transporter ATP-binding protein [Thermodesulfobacteriota bacterium]